MQIGWIDACKGMGIILVYYGHVIECLADTGLKSSYLQWVCLYSFHMPVFFVLSGYVHPRVIEDRIYFLKKKLIRIVVPILFYNILFWFLQIIIEKNAVGHIDLYSYVKRLSETVLTGETVENLFCGITWFLYCIMSVYGLHAIFSRILKSKKIISVFIIIFGLIGYWITSPAIGAMKIARFWGIWYFDEAFVAYTFFLIGVLFRSLEIDFAEFISGKTYLVAAVINALLWSLTVSLNDGPFRWTKKAVVMALRSHGELIFYLPAIAGSITLICLARLLYNNRILERIGRNSIPYICLNSLFQPRLNIIFIKEIYDFIGLPKTHFITMLMVGVIAFGSIAIVTPIVEVFSRYIPSLTGAHAPKAMDS